MQLVNGLGSRGCLLGLLALFAVSSAAWADVPASPPSSWIYDGANLLKPQELTELATLRAQLEQKTGTRLVVLTLASAEGESSKTIAVRTLNEWNAGRKSALLLVLLSPRELYIQPGTDLASVLDSATSSSICSGVIAPKMRSGDRAAALRAGLEAIAARISSPSSASTSSSMPSLPLAQDRSPASYPERSEPRVRSSAFFDTLGWGAGLVGLLTGIWGVSRLLGRKCTECGKRMSQSSRTTVEPTYSSSGEGLHTFSCGSCGYTFSQTYFISQLVESTSSSSDSTWSSSSSDSSWSSSSSDSSSSSSSSSSSDGSGGGGSSW